MIDGHFVPTPRTTADLYVVVMCSRCMCDNNGADGQSSTYADGYMGEKQKRSETTGCRSRGRLLQNVLSPAIGWVGGWMEGKVLTQVPTLPAGVQAEGGCSPPRSCLVAR